MNYELSTLMKLRENKKNAAASRLKEAIFEHENAKNKLQHIQNTLIDSVQSRSNKQNNLFLTHRSSGCNRNKLMYHASNDQKILKGETELKHALFEQESQIRLLELKVNAAKDSALLAEQNFKLIEKHYQHWQAQKKAAHLLKEEYINDDFNNAQYSIKKTSS